MFKAYKYRIYPTEPQRELIEKTFGCCRLVYNLALQVKMTAYKNSGVRLSCYDLQKQLIDTKKEFKWMCEVDSQALNTYINTVDEAFKNFFRGAGYPKFKNKYGKQSFQCQHNARRVDFENELLTIPKIHNIPIAISRRFEGKIKTVTISKTPTGKYFASILVDNGVELPSKKPIEASKTIGIDLGLKDFAITSNGLKFGNPKFLKKNLQRLKVLQRRASRKNKGSSNRKKANKKIAIQHERITNMRNDFLHKLSSKLVSDNQTTTICIENLNVKGMVRNHCLAQAISDVSWGEFTRELKYKCEWGGKNLVQIGRFEPSSKTCSTCGATNETLTLADREWICANCGVTHDRDINAAKNIKEFGLKKTFRDGQSR